MKILASIDLPRLEAALLRRLEEHLSSAASWRAPLIVLVTTSRLARYLKCRLLERRTAAAGVYIDTHHGISRRILEHALVRPPRLLPTASLMHLLDRLVARLPHQDASHLRRYAGARRALVSTLAELREATVTPAQLGTALSGTEGAGWLPELYARFEAELLKLATSGWSDAAGLTRLAMPHARAFLERKRIDAIIQYGAYELTGANVLLLEALEDVAAVELYLPSDIGPPACRYAERFIELLKRRGKTSCTPLKETAADETSDWCRRLAAMYVETPVAKSTDTPRSARPESDAGGVTQLDWLTAPAAPRAGSGESHRHDRTRGREETHGVPSGPLLELRHTQGFQAELESAALRALALHTRQGIPWSELAIVARSLEPYTPFLEHTFAGLGIPYTTSATLPLRRAGPVRSFLLLVRLYTGDFERAAVLEALRSGDLRFDAGAPAPRDLDLWDRSSRTAGIVRHLSDWKELPRLVSGRGPAGAAAPKPDGEAAAERRSLEKLLALLDELAADARLWSRARTLPEHAAALEEIASRRLLGASPAAAVPAAPVTPLEQVLTILASLRDTALSIGDGAREVDAEEILTSLENAAAETALRPRSSGEAGVPVLDLMQARGLTHRVVQWLGFHHGLFPRLGRADPCLDDDARSRLRQATNLPIGRASDTPDEERLLLAMTLASTRERCCISYQRADETGRQRARSSALREVARVFTGRADMRRLHEQSAAAAEERRPDGSPALEAVPAHCGERAALMARSPRFGVLPVADVLVACAAGALDPVEQTRAAMRELGAESEARLAALGWLSLVESFGAPPRGAEADGLDGLTGLGIGDRALSATALERLANCPQAFFLRDVLRTRELDPEPQSYRLEVRTLGVAAHDALKALAGALDERGAWGAQRDDAAKLARELLPDLWNRALESAAGPSLVRLRGLYRLLRDRWLKSLERFVLTDLDSSLDAGVAPLFVEDIRRATLKLSDGLELRAFGRLDRVLGGGDTLLVDDYKTSGDLDAKVRSNNILRGRNVQLPLYREIIADAAGVDPQSVTTRCLGVGPAFDSHGAAAARLAWDPNVRTGFLETLGVVVDLARRGRYPLNEKSAHCGYCPYRSTCRRSHEPTLERLAADPRLRDYFDLEKKTRRDPTLEAARERERGLVSPVAERCE